MIFAVIGLSILIVASVSYFIFYKVKKYKQKKQEEELAKALREVTFHVTKKTQEMKQKIEALKNTLR
jgi:hypothetical protein